MTSASSLYARQQANLNVLRRRDPSIVSIMDQFSHVCVYHHDGQKWEKQGFEGSMFLYERDSYPPYGFYILNRMGMNDYNQRLYPEDDLGAHGSYLMLRSYPDFTNRRLQLTQAHNPAHLPNMFSEAWKFDSELYSAKDKGKSSTVGLWTLTTEHREPMIDVMLRLHSYIKRNIPYPDQYRYGPDNLPPPNPRSASSSPSKPRSVPPANNGTHSSNLGHQTSPSAGGMSELDRLLSKLIPQGTTQETPAPATHGKMTVESLFATMAGGTAIQSNSNSTTVSNSIYSSQPRTTKSQPPQHTTQQPIKIFSPTPTTTALPQILNQDVISTLLGLPPSRSTSAADSIASASSFGIDVDGLRRGPPSHPSSREGDNEETGSDYEDDRNSDDRLSESSTVLDMEGEEEDAQRHQQSTRTNTNILIGDSREDALTLLERLSTSHSLPDGPPAHDSKRPPPVTQSNSLPTLLSLASSAAQVGPNVGHNKELWQDPGANSALNERPNRLDDGDIVELDFSETSALNDLSKWSQRKEPLKPRDAIINGRKEKGKSKARDNGSPSQPHTATKQPPAALSSPYVPSINGNVSSPSSLSSKSGTHTAKSSQLKTVLDPELTKATLLDAVSGKVRRQLERNEFIREVLTLIHTDKAFVDRLWQDYLTRST